MIFYKLFTLLAILLMLSSIFGVVASLINANLWQLVISISLLALSSMALAGQQQTDKKLFQEMNIIPCFAMQEAGCERKYPA